MEDSKENKDNPPTVAEELAKESRYKNGARGSPDWKPDYFDALVAFYADPLEERTLKQFCIELELSYDMVIMYKAKHGSVLWPAVENSRAKFISPARSKLWRLIFSSAKASFNDRKLAAQLIGDLIERSEIKSSPLTPEEKRAKIEQIMTILSAKVEPKKKVQEKPTQSDKSNET